LSKTAESTHAGRLTLTCTRLLIRSDGLRTGAIDRRACFELPDETQLLWFKDLAPAAPCLERNSERIERLGGHTVAVVNKP